MMVTTGLYNLSVVINYHCGYQICITWLFNLYRW